MVVADWRMQSQTLKIQHRRPCELLRQREFCAEVATSPGQKSLVPAPLRFAAAAVLGRQMQSKAAAVAIGWVALSTDDHTATLTMQVQELQGERISS